MTTDAANAPLHVALTGNIASGKSTVAAMLRDKGAVIIDADLLAREAVLPGTAGFDAVVERFGNGVVAPDGALDRDALRQRIFRDDDERQALNAIIHPIVARLRDRQLRKASKQGAPIVVSDIPLLYEVGLAHLFPGVILVDAPDSARLQRLVADRGLDEDDARAIMASQMPAQEKRKLATWVIDNGGTRDQLASQVDALWSQLLETPRPLTKN